MSRSTVVAGGRTYTVSSLEPRARAEVRQAIISARLVDDATDLPVTAPTRISATLAGLVPVAATGGYVGLVGRPSRVLPNLRLQPYPVQVTIDADGYLPWSESRSVPQQGGFPAQFVALPLGEIRLRREPIVLTVSTVRLDGANRLVARPGASVAVNGVWRHVTDLRDPPSSATLLALDPGLTHTRPSGASVDVPALTLPPEAERTLLAGAQAGETWLSVSRRGLVSPADLVALDSSDPGRAEYVEVAAVQGPTDPESPARFGLAHPLARAHTGDTDVRRVVAPGPPAALASLTAPAVAGATTLEVTSLAGIAAGSVVRISGGAAAPEYRRADRYSVTTNADGTGHLPPLSGYVAARLVASAGALGAIAKVTLTHPQPSLELTLT